MKVVAILLSSVLLCGCGAAKAARETGQMFDKYGCISRDFKGETPCPAEGQ